MHELHIGELNGRFTVYWYENGKRRRFRLTAKTRKEAIVEAEKRHKVEMIKAPPVVTVAMAYEWYQTKLSGREYAKMLTHAWKNIGPFFGSINATDISDELVNLYISERSESFRRKNKREINPTTLHHEIRSLRLSLNHAKRMGYVSAVPNFKVPPPSEPDRVALSPAEIQRVLDAAQPTPHLYLLMLLLLGTAARVGAALELTWDRVDFENRTIDLRKPRKVPMKRRPVVPINEGLLVALKEAKARSMSDHVVEWRGKPIRSVKTAFNRVRRDTGINRLCPHLLRHTAAVIMVSNGFDLLKVSQFLGHSSMSITEKVYARYQPKHMQNEASVLDFHSKRNTHFR